MQIAFPSVPVLNCPACAVCGTDKTLNLKCCKNGNGNETGYVFLCDKHISFYDRPEFEDAIYEAMSALLTWTTEDEVLYRFVKLDKLD